MDIQKETAEAYQPLFDLMAKKHNLILLQSEMDEIVNAVEDVNKNLHEIYRIKCDIKNCNETASTQGIYLQDYGYICLCPKHSQYARENKKMVLKKSAIEREAARDENGYISSNY